VTFRVRDRDGQPVDDRHVEQLAGRARISLRTGCFCNPGAGETAFGLHSEQLRPWFGHSSAVTQDVLRAGLRRAHGIAPSAVRVSLGVASTFADVYALMCFLQQFSNHQSTRNVA
jgi:selenocysteine lyase/cysteine desulfurase